MLVWAMLKHEKTVSRNVSHKKKIPIYINRNINHSLVQQGYLKKNWAGVPLEIHNNCFSSLKLHLFMFPILFLCIRIQLKTYNNKTIKELSISSFTYLTYLGFYSTQMENVIRIKALVRIQHKISFIWFEFINW